MSFLERFGLSSSRSSRSPRRGALRLEGRTSSGDPRLSRRKLLERIGLLVALTALALVAYPNVSSYDGSGTIGQIWGAEDVVAPFDFPLRLPQEEIEARQDSIRAAEPPVFQNAPDAVAQTIARLDSIDARLDSTFAAYFRWQVPSPEASPAQIRQDSSDYLLHVRAVTEDLSRAEWRVLLSSAVQASRTGSTPIDDRLLGEVARIAREILPQGVLNVERSDVAASQIVVRSLEGAPRTEEYVELPSVLGRDEAQVMARRSLGAAFPGRPDTVDIGAYFFSEALSPSLLYQEASSMARLAEKLAAVFPTSGLIQENYTIIRRGDVVTAEKFQALQSLEFAQRERSGNVSWVRTGIGRLILVVSTLTLFFLYLYLLRPVLFSDTRKMLLVTLLLSISLAGYFVAGLIGGAAPYAVPVALTSVLLTIVFDSRVGSFATITLALLGGLIFGYDFELAFVTLVAGVLAVFSVRDVKNRSQLLATAGLVLVVSALLLLGFDLLRAAPFGTNFLRELAVAPIHAVFLLLSGPILLVLERVFRETTDITLLELSDTNRPLLKELSLRAPGTFNHSLQVANLAEAAADAVGVNALRARVGALYHDIGKMRKPEYFIENQQPGENPHEKLKPSMSALVIAAHVKDGIELGREYNLPEVVVDFISSHHGTGLMEYFYRRAQELTDEDVDEAEYRYPGPRPATNEQAIVMLADSVEAASRSLEKPTPKKLETLIDGIFASRVADGQLDHSSLTFSDLTTVKETFHALLCGIYHFRVKYPDQEDEAPEDGAAEVVPTEEPPATAEHVSEHDTSDTRPTSEERSTLG
ncbi:MAG: HDIG domain-containing metalloprotein [Bacteroidota bacterium]